LAAAAPTRPMPEVTPCDPCLLLLLVVLLVQEVIKLLRCEQLLRAALLPSPLPLYWRRVGGATDNLQISVKRRALGPAFALVRFIGTFTALS
jgi:hypothetical protein